jgi:hypothetical protein
MVYWICLGVNASDHDTLFLNLSSHFQRTLSPFIVSLYAKDSPTLKDMLRGVVAPLLGTHLVVDDENDAIGSKARIPNFSLEVGSIS